MSRQTANSAPFWAAVARGMACRVLRSASVSTASVAMRAVIAFIGSVQKRTRSGTSSARRGVQGVAEEALDRAGR